VALDRLVAMHEAGHIRVSADQFRATAEEIRAEIEMHGYNEQLQSYTRVFGVPRVDASLLLLAHYGYIDAADPRMRSTCARVLQRLGRDGLLYRYQTDTNDGLPPGEGAFGVCSFWAVECLARGGNVEEATRAFERLLSLASDVGLYAEEIAPETGAHLGNFPQAFTHIGLINAALTLAQCRGEAVLAPVVEPASLSVEDP
jgi:GH15 family glucan-1,4-alpha-glucosidase